MKPFHAGQRIKKAREKAGISQEALARLCDVSVRQVSRWESRESMRTETIQKAATALGTTVEAIVKG